MIRRALPIVLGALALVCASLAHTAEARPKPRVVRAPVPVPVKIAAVRKATHEVLWGGSWWKATVLAQRKGFTKIHYVGWSDHYDEWVENHRVRRVGARSPRAGQVEILWGGTWWRGEIIAKKNGLVNVHYTGWSKVWDQWVEAHRVRKLRQKPGTARRR